MNKKSKKRTAAKRGAASIGSRKGGNYSPAIVVGVGASTGGTKSLQRFLAKMPAGYGLAFVLIRHMGRGQKNPSVKLLKNQTALVVVEAKDGMPVLADRIHVIPPDKFLSISGGKLTLQEPVLCNGLRMPIDHFFCSLAIDQRHRGIGVLLSGRGSDGTLGLSEIRAAGGRTIVEDPASAAYPGMPRSAIDAGVADKVMPAEALADAVTEIAAQLMTGPRALEGQPELDADLRAVLDILRAKVGHDFRCYKPSTIIRRIKRRISLAKTTSIDGYVRFLREHPEEVGLLQKDLLIGVTDFFRQPHAWETLEDKVIASIVEGAQPASEIRVWVPGCSTGKEAYSLAMVLDEHVERSGKKLTVQIFATDSDLASLAAARSGIYAKKDFGENVSPERLKRFFVHKEGLFQVAKNIRERIVFAPQNITADPPFSRLDLISCRNLLIYLDQEVQKKIIALFHFALREGGFLFLGTAETVGDREELFEPVSKKWRIYRRIGVGRQVGVEIPVRPTAVPPPADYVEPARAFAKTPPSRMSLTSGAQHMLLDRFAPACVMIDRKLQVLYVHGTVEGYLTFPPGELTTRVVDMAREGLRARLRGAIAKCLQSNKSVSVTARVRRGDKSVAVKTVVSPLRYPREIDGLLLITFEDDRIPVAKTSRDAAATGDIRHLEDELKITREELQSTIEQLENSNDELKASNEEVTAANEELQSANEELETSKEELQSLNEELNTINVRLHEKVDELEGVNNDVVNLLSSTSIATVFLDRELKVKRYTPASTRLMSLIPTDTGRHIADILLRFSDETLLDDARLVLADLTPLSREVQADDGRWYIRRITPYRTQDDRIEGVVITFVDVADIKEAEEALRRLNFELEQRVSDRTAELHAASLYARSLIEASLDPLVTISPEGRITDVNEATEQVTGRTRRELIGTDFSDYFTDPRSAKAGYRKVLAEGHVRDYPLTIRHTSGNTTDVLYNATVYRNQAGEVQGIFAAARDITEVKRAEAALREANETLEQRVSERTVELQESRQRLSVIVDSIADGFYALDREWRFTHVNDAALRHMGKTSEEILGRTLFDVYPEVRGSVIANEYGSAMESVEPHHFESPSLLTSQILEIHAYPSPENLTVLFRDITEKHLMATALREAHERAEWLARFPDENPNPVLRVSADGSALYCNQASMEIPGLVCEVGKQLPAPLLPLVGQAMAAGQEIQQDVELGEHVYSVAVVPIPGEGYANVYGRDITERKHAEEALRESEERYRYLVKHAPTGIYEIDYTTGRFIEVNDAMCQMLGYTRDEILAMAAFDILADEGKALFASRIQLGRSGEGLSEAVEYPVRTKDGRIIWALLNTMFHRIDGRITRATVVAHDITERKLAEEALQTTLQRLHALVASMHSSILLVGEGRIELANQAFCDYLELQDSPADLVGLTPRQLIEKIKNAYLHPDEQVKRIWEIARQRQPVISEEISMRDGRTSLRDFIPIYEDGKSYGLLWHHIDITERKKAEDALSQSEERYRNLFNSLIEGFCIIEMIFDTDRGPVDYRFLEINPAFEELTGLYEAQGKLMRELAPEHEAYWFDIYGKIALTGEPAHFENEAKALNRWYEVRAFRMGGQESRKVAICFNDITKRKQAEQILRDRTAELEVANRELESFSYSVSHDLRAPLRAIDGYARMILKKEGDKFDEETMRKFNVIRSSSQMMGQLIDDILTLSRVVKKHLSTSQLEIDTVIREVWKELETINSERNIKLTVRDCPAAYGDRTLIKQVYANLLANAAKFTKGRDPALIETGGYIEGNENVYYVRDNGVGFEMEYYDKLFGIFQRLHKPDEFEGTGVGLAIVERIVQRHGGRVWAEGKVNEGATFYITLPQRR